MVSHVAILSLFNSFTSYSLFYHLLLAGALYIIRQNSSIFSQHPRATAEVERTLLHAQLLVFAFYACLLQALGVGSAVIFAISGAGLFVGVGFDVLVLFLRDGTEHVPLITYAVGQVLPQLFGAVVFYTTVDIFVPLVCVLSLYLKVDGLLIFFSVRVGRQEGWER